MKFTLPKNELIEKLSLSARFTSSKLTSATALQGVLVKGEKDKIHIYSTDLNTYYHTTCDTDGSDTFEIIVEPKKIMEFLQFLPPGNVDIEIKEKQILLKQGKTKGNFPIIVSEEYPLPPTFKDTEKQGIDAKFFVQNMPRLLFSASRDDARPVLTGVNFVPSENELLMVTTDGFRLSLVKTTKLTDIPSMIVPADFLQEVVKGAKEAKELFFGYSEKEKMISFQIAEHTYYSRLIEGDFPPFERVIPAEKKTTVTLDKDDFLRNIKLISIFARDYSNVVVCSFRDGTVTMTPKKEGNEENASQIDVQMEGEEQRVAFNYRYLLDFLNTIDTDTLIIEILRSEAPIALKIPKNDSFLHIIMPVRLQE